MGLLRKMSLAKLRLAVLFALIPGLLGLALIYWPVTAGLEKTYGLDLFFKMRGDVHPPADVCVVAIDDASYTELGVELGTLWPRELHAQLIRTLKAEGARAIAFDVLFDAPRDPAQDVQLELALFDAGNVVLGSTVELIDDPRFRQAKLIDPIPAFAESAALVAEVELPRGHDGVIRETWLVPDDRPSLALGAFEVATGDRRYRDERGARLIRYYGPPRTIPTVSVYQALDPAQYLPPGYFRDKIVFVGAAMVAAVDVTGIKDSFPTPFTGGMVGDTYGVEIHATIAANLIDGSRIETLSPRGEAALLFVLALAASLLFIYLKPLAGVAALVVLEIGAWTLGYAAFTRELWLPTVIPSLVQLPAAYVISLIWYYFTTVREREKIRRAFSFYLSPDMIRKISEGSEEVSLGGEEIEGTALFTDIAGFTSIAETKSAPETAAMLNEYFSEITRTIFDTSGTLIKYIGDAVFAIWGAPVRMDDHATRACRAAVDMARMQRRGDDGTAAGLVTRIGVHTGSMLVGNLGSTQRFDYTAIGDTVNLAARLESLNKSIGTLALVSGETLARTDGNVVVRFLGRIGVVGRAEPIELYELLGWKGDTTHPDSATVADFETAVALFVDRRFAEAEKRFRQVLQRCDGSDGPSELYLETIAGLQSDPPGDGWNGVIRFTKK